MTIRPTTEADWPSLKTVRLAARFHRNADDELREDYKMDIC